MPGECLFFVHLCFTCKSYFIYIYIYIYIKKNISAFLQYHVKPLSQKVKSFIKDTNDFLKKLNELWDLPDDFILCTIDVVGLYPNIPHDEGLEAIRKALDKRKDQTVSTDSLILLAECVLKNNVFQHNMRYFKQLQAKRTAPPYVLPHGLNERVVELEWL